MVQFIDINSLICSFFQYFENRKNILTETKTNKTNEAASRNRKNETWESSDHDATINEDGSLVKPDFQNREEGI